MVLEPELRTELADTIANNPHTNLAVGNRFPAFGYVGLFRCFLETLDGLLRRSAGARDYQCRHPQTH